MSDKEESKEKNKGRIPYDKQPRILNIEFQVLEDKESVVSL